MHLQADLCYFLPDENSSKFSRNEWKGMAALSLGQNIKMVGSNVVSTRFKANDLQRAKPLSQSLSEPIGSFEVSQANHWMK